MSEEHDWIKTTKNDAKDLYNECTNEIAIQTYLVSLQHLLDEISYMDSTELHYYSKSLIFDAMQTFSSQFLEEIKQAIVCKSNTQKRAILLDLEDALVRVLDVFENTIDSTVNTNIDRQIFTSLAIDTKVCNLSPKLCHFYSKILEEIINIFEDKKENRKYAFLLNPSIRYNTEAVQILTQSNTNNRIMIIYISESSMEAVNKVPIFLLHEAFHLITRQRNRMLRAKKLAQLAIYGLKQHIFQNSNISDDLQERLLAKWLGKLEEEVNSFNTKEESDPIFYSKNIVSKLESVINESLYLALQTINAEIFIEDAKYDFRDKVRFNEFDDIYADIQTKIKTVERNICDIFFHGTVKNMLEMYMRIFRECYADLALVETLKISPNIYENAFDESIRFNKAGNSEEEERKLRSYLVAKAVEEHFKPNDISWNEYTNETNKQIVETPKDINQNTTAYEKVTLSPYMLTAFEDYFSKCAEDFKEMIGRPTIKHRLDKFRKKLYDVLIDSETENTFSNILENKAVF